MSSLDATLQQLRQVRTSLLHLHKALLESTRFDYEQLYGPIPNKGEYFRLVISHEYFGWLRPISQFIVQIDELISAKEPATLEDANVLLQEARRLLQPSEEGTTLQKQYYQAIQKHPDIALMHADFSSLLASNA